MQHVSITTIRYHTHYRSFSISLARFGGYLQRLPHVTIKFIKKMYINIFLKKLTITPDNPFQITPEPWLTERKSTITRVVML